MPSRPKNETFVGGRLEPKGGQHETASSPFSDRARPRSDKPGAKGWRAAYRSYNNTHQPITEIYVADDGTDNWQGDGLGSEFLLPGNSVSVDIDDQNGNCRVDIKTVLDNGSILVHRGVNACRAEGSVVSIR